jgi:phage/plasmid-like protein (TIGR03299 family)
MMAHEITETDKVGTYRQPTWHGLETHTWTERPSLVQVRTEIHPWEVTTEASYRKVVEVGPDGELVERYEEVEHVPFVVRDDTTGSAGVLAGKSQTLELVSNRELYEVAAAIQGESENVLVETAGSLRGGRSVWLLLELNEPIQIPGDPSWTKPYYALQNAHDGSGAFRGQGTAVRIVCANTSHMADLDASVYGTEFTFRHTKNVSDRIEEAKKALAGWRTGIHRWARIMARLNQIDVDERDIEHFLEEFVPEPPLVSDRVKDNVARTRGQIRQTLALPTNDGIRDTAYGLVQAAIEFQNHVRRAQSQETRFRRAVLERSVVTRDAAQIVARIVTGAGRGTTATTAELLHV